MKDKAPSKNPTTPIDKSGVHSDLGAPTQLDQEMIVGGKGGFGQVHFVEYGRIKVFSKDNVQAKLIRVQPSCG